MVKKGFDDFEMVVTFPSLVKKEMCVSRTSKWLFLGRDYLILRKIENILGADLRRIDIARTQKDVVDNTRQDYIEWIDELNALNGSNLEWWFGPISSRNVYESNLYQYLCYIRLLDRLRENGSMLPNLLILESATLSYMVKKWADSRGVKIRITGCFYEKLKEMGKYFLPFFKWGYFVLVLLVRALAAYITRLSSKAKKPNGAPLAVIDTFVHLNSFDGNCVFRDRYFPFLYEFLREKGFSIAVHPVLYGLRLSYMPIYRMMRKSKEFFIIPEDYLGWMDYIKVLTYPLRTFLLRLRVPDFHGIEMGCVVRSEQKLKLTTSALFAVFTYHLFCRLKNSELKPVKIISWYENQVINKAMIAGIRKSFPDANVIGAQIFIHPPNILNLFPVESEYAGGFAPDVLLATSQYQCEVATSFTRSIPCESSAALRYAHVFLKKNVSEISTTANKNKTILVFMSFDLSEAVEILEVIKSRLDQIDKNVRILVKCHPDYSSKKLINFFGAKNWPSRFEIFHGIIAEALDIASIVVASISSSIIEAAARGIPVVFLGRQIAINNNFFTNIKTEIVTECYSGNEFINAVENYLNVSDDQKKQYVEMGKHVRDLFFTPVSNAALQPYIGKH